MIAAVLLLAFPFHAAQTSPTFRHLHVPGGFLVPERCHHNIDEEFRLEAHPTEVSSLQLTLKRSGKKLTVPPCESPIRKWVPSQLHGSAWRAWAQYSASSSKAVTSLTSTWNVPVAPISAGGQLLYYWNGVEPGDESAVLQPVLQWGSSPAGGGDYWAFASWYVSSVHGSFNSKLVNASIGHFIRGKCENLGSSKWRITGTDLQTGANSSFEYTPQDGVYAEAYHVLEAYSVTDCRNQYPSVGNITFSQIQVEVNGNPVVPTWVPMTQTPYCNEHAVVKNSTDVVICF